MAAAKPDDSAIYLKQSRTALIGILILCSVFATYFARDFLLPVTAAFLIAMTFRPVIRWLSRRGVPAWVTASCLALVIMFGGLTAGYLISGPVSGWIADAPAIQRTFMAKIGGIRAAVRAMVASAATDELEAQLGEQFLKSRIRAHRLPEPVSREHHGVRAPPRPRCPAVRPHSPCHPP